MNAKRINKVVNHEYWMREALKEARVASEEKEIPVGAVVVLNDRIIGRGHNQVEALQDSTAHAEMVAITSASRSINNWRLDGASIYATLEPCPMCAGAISLSRISKCIFGTRDPRFGALESIYQIKDKKLEIVSGILENECKELIEDFFKTIRERTLDKSPCCKE